MVCSQLLQCTPRKIAEYCARFGIGKSSVCIAAISDTLQRSSFGMLYASLETTDCISSMGASVNSMASVSRQVALQLRHQHTLHALQGITTGNVTANVSSGNLISTSAAEAARPQPARMASPAAGGGGSGGGSGRILPPMPTAVPQTEREKELAAKAELRRARRFYTAPRV